MKLKLQKPIAFFDIESTGVNVATDRIIELAIIKIYPDQHEESQVYKLNPTIPISAESSAIHGFTDEIVKDYPTFADKADAIYSFLEQCDFGGYNSNRFDIPMLVEEFLRLGKILEIKNRKMIDVFRVFTAMEKRDLTTAYKFYCKKDLTDAHSALADIKATYEVLQAQLDRYDDLSNSIDSLHEISKDIDFVDLGRRMVYVNGEPVFNFGKYKGKPVKQVISDEPSYYSWIMRSDFMLHTKQKLKEIKLTIKHNS